MAKKTYDDSSLTLLKGAERIRKKPESMLGSNGLEGCEHVVFEIISNSIDEAREGYGKVIELTYFRDLSIEVRDFGRGIPLGFNEKENRYNWEIVFCELYGGGKYENNSGENYEFSLGTNGLGACATQYTSEYMNVTVFRDGYKHTLFFEKGENVGGLFKEEMKYRSTGTVIKWKPDLEVFTDIKIPLEYFQTVLKKQAVVNPGITFRLKYEGEEVFEEEYCYQKGIEDYVEEVTALQYLTEPHYIEAERRGRDREDQPEYKVKMSAVFCFSREKSLIEYYHNSSFLEYGGAPDKATRSAFVSVLDQYLRQNNKYTKNESKISFADVEDSLVLVISSFSTMTSYLHQTKKGITNKFIQEAMTDFLKESLEIYLIEHKTEAEKIAAQVLLNKRSRESAERARTATKKKLTGTMDVTNRVQKFVDCRTKDVSRREIYIVEGDSALGACKSARDSEFQAIIPVRGKILNCLKADYSKVFKSEIITDLVKVLGCGVEVSSKHNKGINAFDINNLRWAKVIICTDADVDGFQIRTLILTMIYRLMPQLIKEGKVYIAESPLFEINTKDETFFAYSEREKAEILAKIGDKKHTIQRSKGLGENDPEMMSLTTMKPETRRLIQVLPEEEEERTVKMFDLLLGDNLQGRKDHIAAVGASFIDRSELM